MATTDTFYTAAEVDTMMAGLQQQIALLRQQMQQPADPPVPVGTVAAPGPATPAIPVPKGGSAP